MSAESTSGIPSFQTRLDAPETGNASWPSGVAGAAASSGGAITASPEREVLAGLVERVTFHNPENGFCVLRVKVRGQRELMTVVGSAAAISAGEFIQASGSWVNDRAHGLQFKAAFLRSAPPTTLEGIRVGDFGAR
jgi:exodeoxyribonuclease V alpha subunit